VELTLRWAHLQEFCEAAARYPELEVWLFGSALYSLDPGDLDVLVMYENRADVVTLRSLRCWRHLDPPLHLIAMTAGEEQFYDFKAVTAAIRLL
jgi:hypothetical protein